MEIILEEKSKHVRATESKIEITRYNGDIVGKNVTDLTEQELKDYEFVKSFFDKINEKL